MDVIQLEDYNKKIPEKKHVSVIMQKTPSNHQWLDYTYQAVGVVTVYDAQKNSIRTIHKEKNIEQFLVTGLTIQLHQDECESYYHNLMSPNPGCFVVTNDPDDPNVMPEPYIVSLSFDEAHAYLEGGEQIFACEIPPELYQWTEAFVLTHYVATKKTKRKLKNWSETESARVTKIHHPS